MSKTTPELRSWGYRAGRLMGCVFGHPRYQDGSDVTTSEVTSLVGRVATTASGSSYVLRGASEFVLGDGAIAVGLSEIGP